MTQADSPATIRRPLPRTRIEVTGLGLGTARLGAFWQRRSPRAGLAALAAAFDAGIGFVDTADCYARGISERLVGTAVRSAPGAVSICTKVGLVKTPVAALSARRHGGTPDSLEGRVPGRADQIAQCFSAGYVRAALHRSLRRLRRDHVELLVLHEPGAEVIRRAEFLPGLQRLQADGDIGAFGVCCTSTAAAQAALEIPGITCLQVPANLTDTTIVDAVSSAARENDVALIGIAVLGDGSLLAKIPPAQRDLALRGCLGAMLADERLSSVLVGASTTDHVAGLIRAAGSPLDAAQLSALSESLRR